MPSPTTKTETVSTKVQNLDFFDALRKVYEGKIIHKQEWSPHSIACMRDDRLQIYRQGKWHIWAISNGDMKGTDYVVF